MTTEQTDINLQDGFFRKHAKYESAKMSENIQAVKFLVNLWWLSIRLLSYTGWILLRFNFGERFLPTAIILFSSFSCYMAAHLSGSRFGGMIAMWLLLIACGHRIQIYRRNKRGDIWHSYDNGTSWIARFVPEHYQEYIAIVEWICLLFVGFTFVLFSTMLKDEGGQYGQFYLPSAFGIYIITVAAAMMLQNNKIKRDARNLYLDARDSQIDNQAFAAMQDRDMKEMDSDSLFIQAGIVQNA